MADLVQNYYYVNILTVIGVAVLTHKFIPYSIIGMCFAWKMTHGSIIDEDDEEAPANAQPSPAQTPPPRGHVPPERPPGGRRNHGRRGHNPGSPPGRGRAEEERYEEIFNYYRILARFACQVSVAALYLKHSYDIVTALHTDRIQKSDEVWCVTGMHLAAMFLPPLATFFTLKFAYMIFEELADIFNWTYLITDPILLTLIGMRTYAFIESEIYAGYVPYLRPECADWMNIVPAPFFRDGGLIQAIYLN